MSLGAMLLGLVTLDGSPLTSTRFHEVFLMMAVVPLLAVPGFLYLRPEDGFEVCRRVRRPQLSGRLPSS